MRFYLWKASTGFYGKDRGMVHGAEEGEDRTLCGKPITRTWSFINTVGHELTLAGKVGCLTCQSRARKLRKERVNNRPRMPEGQMYAGHKVRSI